MQGLWTGGQQTLEQAYLSETVIASKRTEITATLGSFAVIGFVSGPALAAAFTAVDFKIGRYRVNSNTAPAALILVVTAVMWGLSFVLFRPAARAGDCRILAPAGLALSCVGPQA